jgi:predicted DCC family thiol-disulfide oxidoreductase YuxK
MKDTLYYDGQCPLCKREIARLRKISDGLELCDIHAVVDAGLPSRDTLLRNLHFRSAQGEFVTGLDANVAAWQYTRFGWLWQVLQWPMIRPVAARCYSLWARRRYQRLYGGGA